MQDVGETTESIYQKNLPSWTGKALGGGVALVILAFLAFAYNAGQKRKSIDEAIDRQVDSNRDRFSNAEPISKNKIRMRRVTREEFGERWPLTVDSGYVYCETVWRAIFETDDGEKYGLNGIATTAGYDQIDPIWRDNPKFPGAKVNIGVLTKLALEQCETRR